MLEVIQGFDRIARLRAWSMSEGQHFGYQDHARRQALLALELAASD